MHSIPGINKISFKDDQVILSHVILDTKYTKYFNLINEGDNWFMFKNLLRDVNSVKNITV